jgi:predicted permease
MSRQWSRMVLQKRIAKEEIQMQISLLLMQQIAQLFLILLMGYAVVKTGLLKASDSKVLSVVFVYLVMPCVVLNAFQIKDTPEIRTGLLYSMGIAVGMHVVFLLLNALFRKVLKLDAVEQVNIIYSNAAACATVTSMAQLYDRDASHSSAIYVLSTLLSILTMPLMIGLFELLL